MKTVKDLVQLFDGYKTEVEISESIIARKGDGGDIDFKSKDTDSMFGWVSNSYLDNEDSDKMESDLSGDLSVTVPTMFTNVKLFLELAQWMGSEMPEAMTVEKEIEVEVIKEVESPEQHKLGGMVQAYENILLGRDVTVGK